jgi:hypothetical protein
VSGRKPPKGKPFVLRVASFSNFNHTPEERQEVLGILKDKYPLALPFVNTCSGDRLMVDDWPIIITGNPWLEEFIAPSKRDPGFKKIAAVRLKYTHDPEPKVKEAFIQGLKWCERNGIPALITTMRFARIAMMYRYVKDPASSFGRSGAFRPRSNARFTMADVGKMPLDSSLPGKLYKEQLKARKKAEKLIERGVRLFKPLVPRWQDFKAYISKRLWFLCDGKLRGCPWCQNCNWLTYKKRSFEGIEDPEVMPPWVPFQVNLRASRPRGSRISPKGNVHCHHDCPECFARDQLAQSGGIPSLDIQQNEKQKGATSHPYVEEYVEPTAGKDGERIRMLKEERAAGWPNMAPATPPYRPGLPTTLFGWLPGLLPDPDTNTQFVDKTIGYLDDADKEMWEPLGKRAEQWSRERLKGWTKAQKRARKLARDRYTEVLKQYAVRIQAKIKDQIADSFVRRSKRLKISPKAMAEMIEKEAGVLKVLTNQLKLGDFDTIEQYVNHLKVTAALLQSEEMAQRLAKGLTKADEKVVAKAVREGVITKEAGESLLKLTPTKVSKKRLRALATKARKAAKRIEREVLRGI